MSGGVTALAWIVLATWPAEDLQAMSDLAYLYTQEGRTSDALGVYAELRAAQPEEPRWWSAAADVLERVEGAQDELRAFVKAWRRAQPWYPDATVRMVRVHLRLGAWQEGLRLLEELPSSAERARLRAQLYEGSGRRAEAVEARRAVLAYSGATPQDRWHLVQLLAAGDDSDALLPEVTALVAARPADPRFRVAYADALLATEDLDGAERHVAEAKRLAPGDPEVARVEREVIEERARRETDAATRWTQLRARVDRGARLRALRFTYGP